MNRLLDNSENPKDKTYQKIMEQLDGFMNALPSEEDRQLLTKIVFNAYNKHYRSIKSMEGDDPSLMSPLIMAVIVDQNTMIDQFQITSVE